MENECAINNECDVFVFENSEEVV